MTHLECACTKREREREAELDRQDNLDALEEERDVAKACSALYQQQARRYQSREVRAKTYNVGELVLRLPEKKKDKLKPNGERMRVCIIHGLNISHKELTYLLQKSTSHQKPRHYVHAPRGIYW